MEGLGEDGVLLSLLGHMGWAYGRMLGGAWSRGGNSGSRVGFRSDPIMTRHDYARHDTTQLIKRVNLFDPNTT